MFQKPEELIMAILFAFWVVITYFLSAYFTGATTKYVFLISGFTAVWAFVSFLLWQAGKLGRLFPLVLGALVACWWSWLDWLANRDATEFVIKWYNGWTFKLILAMIPVIVGYFYQWKQSRKLKF